jgi:hypothetical protein
MEPSSEALLDFVGVRRCEETRCYAALIKHDERRKFSYLELLGQIRPPGDLDPNELEGVVITATLQHTREVGIGASRRA